MLFSNMFSPFTRCVALQPVGALLLSVSLLAAASAADTASLATKSVSLPAEKHHSAFSAEQRAEIGEIAANWLVEHPEYLLVVSESLRQQQQVVERQAQQHLAQQSRSDLLAGAPVAIGPEHASTTVVIFFDYISREYQHFYATLEKLCLHNPDVRFVYRTVVRPSLNEHVATYAAQVGELIWLNKAGEAYLRYQNRLRVPEQSHTITTNDISKAGAILGNPARLKQLAVDTVSLQARLNANRLLADQLALKELPAIIVLPRQSADGKRLSVLTWPISEESLLQAVLKAKIN